MDELIEVIEKAQSVVQSLIGLVVTLSTLVSLTRYLFFKSKK